MPRSIWSGHLSFGLVTIPVGLHSALEAAERVRFRMLHRKDLAPIQYKKVCSKEREEVPNDEIVRGYEVRKGKFAIVEDEELDAVQEEVGEGEHTIDLLEFVAASSLNPLLFEKPYYVAPQKGGEKAFRLLRDALIETRKVGLARFYMRTRPLLAALMPAHEVLSLEVMREPAELRSAARLKFSSARPRENERKMAIALVEQMSGEWDPTEHPNVYRKALAKLLDRKRAVAIDEPERDGQDGSGKGKVVDLMDALRASMRGTRSRAKRRPARASGARAKRAAQRRRA